MSLKTLLVALGILLAGSEASADEAPVRRPIRVAVLAGYGVNDSNASSGSVLDLYGPGLGIRAGYTFSAGLHLGASYAYHTGFSRDGASGRLAPLGVEGGWDFAVGDFTLRPYVGGGVVFYKTSVDGPQPSRGNGEKAAVWPGLLVMYDVGERAFVGLDARYTFVATGLDTTVVAAGGGSADALGLYADLGLRF